MIKLIKKLYIELLLILSFVILLILVENHYAISKQIFKIARGSKIKKQENIHNNQFYFCKDREQKQKVIEYTYPYSTIISYKEYKKKFLEVNQKNFKNNYCIENTTLIIPEFNSNHIKNEPLQWYKPVHAIYIRWDLADIDTIIKIVNTIKNSKINALVIDVKDIVGILTYKSKDPVVQSYQKQPSIIKDFNKLVYYLHQNNIYVIVRLALFQDMNLINYRKDLAIYNKNTVSNTIEFKGKPIWLDPGKEEVQDYNLRIFKELLSFGVDEIQLDYIRYPAEGDLSGVVYYNVQSPEDKIKNLEKFLFKVWLLKFNTNTKLSIDVFGITGWQEEKDIKATGQNIRKISKYIDIISPMLYPSHFNRGFEGFENPADHPEYFYSKGLRLFKELIPDYVKIRPWIQAFKWRVSNYGEEYILRQIHTIDENGGYGWMFWNAGNEYTVVIHALKRLDQ